MGRESDATTMTESQDFTIRRDDWGTCKFVPSTIPSELEQGTVEFRVDRFAMTANNITYAQVGDIIGYWKFFPAQEEGWGRIPVMGFADVVRSSHPDVPVGDRVFGFFPMSNHLVIEADRVTPEQYVDAAPHRADSAPVYRTYTRTSGNPLYAADREDQHMLLWGLFMTSFMVDDFMADNDLFGAKTFVISSASSKTAIALAYMLAQRESGEVIGLTSPRNAAFVKDLGYYNRTLTYDDVQSLSADVPTAFIDHSGNGELISALHHHLGDNLKYSGIVGATHWGSSRPSGPLPGAAPALFFAPTQIQKRSQEWGPVGLQERIGEAWVKFRDSSDAWLTVSRSCGPEAVERVYKETLEGRAKPSEGHILSLWRAQG